MQTNDIAASVQVGQGDVLELWQAIRLLAMQRANHWYRAFEGRRGVELDDLEQAAFLALLDALESWNAEKGVFSTWYILRLKKAFTALYGLKTRREQENPLDKAVSLDTPLTDEEEETLADVTPDPAAGQAFACIDERDRQAAVSTALDTLPPDQRAALINEFWFGQKGDAKARNKALRALRHPSLSKQLRGLI